MSTKDKIKEVMSRFQTSDSSRKNGPQTYLGQTPLLQTCHKPPLLLQTYHFHVNTFIYVLKSVCFVQANYQLVLIVLVLGGITGGYYLTIS